MAKVHYLKIWPEFFRAVKERKKTFEMRKNDRDYRVGDILVLREYAPEFGYTRSESLRREVTYILDKQPFVPEGYVCMSIK